MRHRWTLGAIVAAAALVLVGCSTARGGGTLPSANGSSTKSATFGFSVKCNSTTNYLSGNATYADAGLGVSIRATVATTVNGAVGGCNNGLPLGSYQGAFQSVRGAPTFGSHPSGVAEVNFNDSGAAGPSGGDLFEIRLWDCYVGCSHAFLGGLPWYRNLGSLTGGNIQTNFK